MLTHLGICHSAMHYEYCMGLTRHDRALVAVPMSHVTGVIALIAAMTRAAAALIVMREFKAAEFLQLAARERMTHSLMVPAMYNLCLLDPAFAQGDYSAWRVGGYGGAPMAPATIARFAEQAAGPQPDERLRCDRDHLAGHPDAAGRDRAAAGQRRLRAALRRHPGDGRRGPRGAATARKASCGSAARWW